MRLPNPDLINPLASKKAMRISQTVGEPNLWRADSMVKVLVKLLVVIARIAITPMGWALRTTDKMVVRNIANRCHASSERSSGFGQNQQRRKNTTTARLLYLWNGSNWHGPQ